jgi:hypothetical protein
VTGLLQLMRNPDRGRTEAHVHHDSVNERQSSAATRIG